MRYVAIIKRVSHEGCSEMSVRKLRGLIAEGEYDETAEARRSSPRRYLNFPGLPSSGVLEQPGEEEAARASTRTIEIRASGAIENRLDRKCCESDLCLDVRLEKKNGET